uniref:P53 and DNA-damage regulated 1 n=1 Tax=Cynoglossus semilaevis TaxID=244447 RepID=A0A3P8W8S0_CYNSE
MHKKATEIWYARMFMFVLMCEVQFFHHVFVVLCSLALPFSCSVCFLFFLSHVQSAGSVQLTLLISLFQILDLNIKRNTNREALNALKTAVCDSEKVQVCFGNMFIKLPTSKTKEILKRDQEQLDMQINDLRKGLKAKVNHVYEMQGKPELRGYNLCPLTSDEVMAINSILKG